MGYNLYNLPSHQSICLSSRIIFLPVPLSIGRKGLMYQLPCISSKCQNLEVLVLWSKHGWCTKKASWCAHRHLGMGSQSYNSTQATIMAMRNKCATLLQDSVYIYIDSVHTCRVYLSGRLTSQFALESNHMPFTVSDLAVPYRLHCTWSSLKHPWPIPPFHKHLPWLPRTLCIPFKLFDQIKVPSTSWTQIPEEPTLVSRSTSMKSKVLVFALTLRKSSMFSLGRVRRRSWMTASVKSCTRRQALRKRRPSGVR